MAAWNRTESIDVHSKAAVTSTGTISLELSVGLAASTAIDCVGRAGQTSIVAALDDTEATA